MLRITEENGTDNSTTLLLEGRLVNQWIDVLRTSCERAFESGNRLTLDLGGVSFADYEGVRVLRQLEQRQVAFTNSSPFLREQMKQPTDGISSESSDEPAGE
ncbi:MAG: STAS domain-containing protein [Blastocatellia bacterium]